MMRTHQERVHVSVIYEETGAGGRDSGQDLQDVQGEGLHHQEGGGGVSPSLCANLRRSAQRRACQQSHRSHLVIIKSRENPN